MSFNVIKWLKDMKKKSKPSWQGTRVEQVADVRRSNVLGGETAVTTPSHYWNYEIRSDPVEQYTSKINDERIVAKPKDVLSELYCRDEDFKLDLTNLKSKLKDMEKRRVFMKEELNQSTEEEDHAIEWLKSRMRYVKLKERFNWPVTNDVKIGELCKKYKVQTASVGVYKRCIPAEAIDAMEEYVKLYKKVADVQPLDIKLIVDVGGPEQKKDPIIYAASPFGNYYYVLGAWDEEVAILDELFLRK